MNTQHVIDAGSPESRLVAALPDEERRVRMAAALALGDLRTDAARAALKATGRQ